VIVAHPTAGAYVAYTVTADPTHVRVQYFDGAGTPRWPAGGVVAGVVGASQYATEPHLVANPAGGVFVCFSVSGTADDLRCQLVDETGARRWGDPGVSVAAVARPHEWQVVPRGLSDGAGGLMVFWRNQRDPFAPVLEPMLMEGQRFGPDGARLWGPAPRVLRTTGLASLNSHGFRFFQVAGDGAGGAVLAFDDWLGEDPPEYDVVAQRVSPAGVPLWGDGVRVAGGPGWQIHDQTFAAPDGGAFVAIWELLSSTQSRVRLFRLGPDGRHVWPEAGVLVSDPAATALDYSVEGSFDDGWLRLAWTHQLLPDSTAIDVQFAAFSPAGERFASPAGLPLTTAPFQQFLREVVYSRERGGVLAVWDDRRKNDWDDLDVYGAVLADSDWRGRGRFYAVTPCRLLDTRDPAGPRGGPAVASATSRVVAGVGACGIPSTARALAVNLTAVGPLSTGYLAAYAADAPRPATSVLNLQPGRTRANGALLRLSWDGAFALFPFRSDGGATHLVVDVTGYFD
jgi:hypothetical protein